MTSEPNQFVAKCAGGLRLRNAGREEAEDVDLLWWTHDAVNKRAKILADWLLTLRGGLCHTLAIGDLNQRKDRRIILALSWLSVECEACAPDEFLVPHMEEHKTGRRRDWETIPALRQILFARGLRKQCINEWTTDCGETLRAEIPDNVVWVNRSLAFDVAQEQGGPLLTREEAWDLLKGICAAIDVHCREARLSLRPSR